MRRYRLFLFLLLLSVSSPLRAETVYVQPQEALKLIFRNSDKIILDKKSLTDQQRHQLESKTGTKISRSDWDIFVAMTGDKIDGYAIIDHEIGRLEPITYLVAIDPKGFVQSVEVLVYRETVGSEVHDQKFLKQYQNKNSSSPLRVGQDIQNISGATMSARAVTQGVKRDLAVWQVLYGGKS